MVKYISTPGPSERREIRIINRFERFRGNIRDNDNDSHPAPL